jgi:hypothetical protein
MRTQYRVPSTEHLHFVTEIILSFNDLSFIEEFGMRSIPRLNLVTNITQELNHVLYRDFED